MFSKEHFIYFFIAVLLVGAFLRFDLTTLPMNDEVIYTVASAGYFNNYYSNFSAYYDFINPEHPPLAKLLFSTACWFKACKSNEFLAFTEYYALSIPVRNVAEKVGDLMQQMRLISFLAGVSLIVLFWYFLSSHSDKSGLVAALLVAISPLLIIYSSVVMLDIFLVLFYAAAVLFYFFVYRKDKNWKNLAILGVLAILAFGSKQYLGFTLIPLLLLAEFFDTRKVDWKLSAGLFSSLVLFFLFVYPFEVFIKHLTFFDVGARTTINPMQFMGILGMESYALLFALVFSLYKLFTTKDKELSLAWFMLVVGGLMSLIGPAGFTPRYSLYVIPLLLLPASMAFKNSKKAFVIFLVLVVASFFVQYSYQPYYEGYRNVLGSVVINSSTIVERQTTIGALNYLETNNVSKYWTNDFYGLPYYRKITGIHFYQVFLQNLEDACTKDEVIKQATKSTNTIFVYRKNDWRLLSNFDGCQTLPRALGNNILYEDAYYTIYSHS